jgi:hypothetical protein
VAEFEKPPAGIIEANVAATPTGGGGQFRYTSHRLANLPAAEPRNEGA